MEEINSSVTAGDAYKNFAILASNLTELLDRNYLLWIFL